jgi:hypothetical protein
MGDPKNPDVGDSILDASEVKLVDLSLDQIRRASKLYDGFEGALAAIRLASDDVKKRCKIDPAELTRIEGVLANLKMAQRFAAPLAKLSELISETIIADGSEIAVFLTEVANSARDRAEREDEGKAPKGEAHLPAVLEALLKYQFGRAIQGAQTRQQNQQAAEKPGTDPKPNP